MLKLLEQSLLRLPFPYGFAAETVNDISVLKKVTNTRDYRSEKNVVESPTFVQNARLILLTICRRLALTLPAG